MFTLKSMGNNYYSFTVACVILCSFFPTDSVSIITRAGIRIGLDRLPSGTRPDNVHTIQASECRLMVWLS